MSKTFCQHGQPPECPEKCKLCEHDAKIEREIRIGFNLIQWALIGMFALVIVALISGR